jgi:pimeloyl-ACP methyl ester carboxylesterase
MPQFNPLPVEPTFSTWRGHRVANYTAGTGQPVLLVHSINAAASSFEMRGPFRGLQDTHAVHAIDLLGFGRSDRPNRRYLADDYIDLIGDTLLQIGQPAVIVASTLGAAFSIAAADRWPDRVKALVLVCPVGITLLSQMPGTPQFIAYALLRGPVGEAIFAGLVTRPSMNYFIKDQTYADPAKVDEETFNGFYDAAHQPGAAYAPLCFVTGLLNCNIAEPFARLRQPVLIAWGRKAEITKLKQADPFMQRNPRARLEIFDNAGMIVQDEFPDEFNALVREFLASNNVG